MSRRRLIALAAVAAVLVVAVVVWRWRASAAKPRLQIESAKVDRGRIIAKVTATGTLSAIVTVQVGSQVSGRVAALYADFNSPVKKGQLIAKIDPQLFQAAVEQARANLVAAQGNLAKSKAQAVDADRQYQRAVALAQAARQQAEVNLAYTDIASPPSGVAISRNVGVGQTVAASLQAPTLFVIAEDLAKMQVDTSVAEADVGRLTAGMGASFTVDAYPSETFQGSVRQIRNAPQTVQNVVTYDAVIDVGNPALKLKPGMTANVTFVYAEKDDVLRIPNTALRFRPPPDLPAFAPGAGRPGGRGNAAGGSPPPKAVQTPDQRTVWVMREEKPAPARIKTGISDGAFTEVVEGALEPGDSVVTDASGPAGGMAATLRRPFSRGRDGADPARSPRRRR